jgi:hypothetical protein
MRPEKLHSCANKFVAGQIGEQFLSICETDFATLMMQFRPNNPTIIIADEQIDVVSALENVAKMNGVSCEMLFARDQEQLK